MDEVDCQTLENLHRLRQQNILSEEEYETAKAKILQKINSPEVIFPQEKQDFSYESTRLFLSAFAMVPVTFIQYGTALESYYPFIHYEIYFIILIGIIGIFLAIRLLATPDGPRILPIATLMIIGSCLYWYLQDLIS